VKIIRADKIEAIFVCVCVEEVSQPDLMYSGWRWRIADGL
jgi:hypothetical protein